MPRNKKSESTVAEALNTPLERTLEEAADYLGVAPIRLQELFCDRLQSAEPMVWLTVPTEHEERLEIFKREIDAENSVRRFDNPTEPATELLPVVEEELPIIQDEAPKPKRGKGGKLTQKKSEALKTSDQNAQKLACSDLQIKQTLHARKGQKSGAQLATIELAAEDLTYRKIKGEALVRKVGQLTSEIATESDFDPIQLLAELGIDSNSEIFEDLKQQIEPALGKLDSATTEIVENAWVNGINLGVELSQLENLLNSNELTADYWQ